MGFPHRILSLYTPQQGPRNTHDLLLALAILKRQNPKTFSTEDNALISDSLFEQKTFEFIEEIVASYSNDIPASLMQQQLQEDLDDIPEEFLENLSTQTARAINMS